MHNCQRTKKKPRTHQHVLVFSVPCLASLYQYCVMVWHGMYSVHSKSMFPPTKGPCPGMCLAACDTWAKIVGSNAEPAKESGNALPRGQEPIETHAPTPSLLNLSLDVSCLVFGQCSMAHGVPARIQRQTRRRASKLVFDFLLSFPADVGNAAERPSTAVGRPIASSSRVHLSIHKRLQYTVCESEMTFAKATALTECTCTILLSSRYLYFFLISGSLRYGVGSRHGRFS